MRRWLLFILVLTVFLLMGCDCLGDKKKTEIQEQKEQIAAAEGSEILQQESAKDRMDDPGFPEENLTVESGEDLQKALSIVQGLKEKKGIEISALSDARGVGEILFEAGYEDVDAAWLLLQLQEAEQNVINEQEYDGGPASEATLHIHTYAGTLDQETRMIRYVCEECGDSYEEPMPWGKKDAGELAQPSAEPETTSPLGNESRKYDGEEYFSLTIVPVLYQEWGENHYQWYYDPDTAMIRIGVTVDGMDGILQDAKEENAEALDAWQELTGEVTELSAYIQTTMNEAGFRATRIQVSLMDSKGAYLYTAEGGEVWYDYMDSYYEATGKDPLS